MSVIIVGVDPGESTGVAILSDGNLVNVFQGEASDAISLVEIMCEHAKLKGDRLIIACERFVSMRSGPKTHQPKAQQIAGVMDHIAEAYGMRCVKQGPADAWAVASNEVLKKLGIYQRGSDVSQRDANDVNMALRHAVLFLAREYASVFESLLVRGSVIPPG